MMATVASFVRHLRTKVVLTAALLGALAGFLISFAFQPKYVSQSLVLVEQQTVAASIVQPVVSQDLTQRVATLQQRALSAENLRPLIETLGVASGSNVDSAIEGIRDNVGIAAVVANSLGPIPPDGNRQSALPGFNVSFTASTPRRAQEICVGVTNIIIRENLNDTMAAANNTRDFLNRAIEDEKNNLMTLAVRLATLKKLGGRSPAPEIDAREKILTIEYDSEQRSYVDLLAKRRSADLMRTMNSEQLGETISVLNPADLPDAPEFPDRMLFAIWGLGAGLMMGILVIPFFKLRGDSRRKVKKQSPLEELPVPAANG